jgi:hypothetical protein
MLNLGNVAVNPAPSCVFAGKGRVAGGAAAETQGGAGADGDQVM